MPANAFLEIEKESYEKNPRWKVFAQYSKYNYLMCRSEEGNIRYAPLCIYTFRLIAPRRLLEAQILNQQYHCYEDIKNIPDRLKWCRHHEGLMQKEVVNLLGITKKHYQCYENGYSDYYPKEIVDKLSELYQVAVDDLLDDYNRFLYHGQGRIIREYRESLGLTKKQFALMIHINPGTFQRWEREDTRVAKSSWEKYLKNIIKV